jgi:hypothetical protein
LLVYQKNGGDEVLVNKIKAQNNIFNGSELMVKAIVQSKEKNFFIAVLETDIVTYNKAMTAGRVWIDWDHCRVYEGVYVRRCYNCLGFGHQSNNCNLPKTCANCAIEFTGSHSCCVEVKKCCNCLRFNNEAKLNLKTDHNALDRKCEVYLKKLEFERRKVFT